MTLSKLSYLLTLLVWGLVLSELSLNANESSPLNPKNNKTTTSQPPTPTPAKRSSKQQAHPSTSNQDTNSDKRGTEEQPLVIKSATSQKTTEEGDSQRTNRDDKPSDNGWFSWVGISAIAAIVSAGAALLTAVIAGIAACIAIRTLRAIEKQVIANEKAAIAAENAADAATRQLRAYIGIHDLEIDWFPVKLAVKVWFKNYGATPAYDFSCLVRLHHQNPLRNHSFLHLPLLSIPRRARSYIQAASLLAPSSVNWMKLV